MANYFSWNLRHTIASFLFMKLNSNFDQYLDAYTQGVVIVVKSQGRYGKV